MVVKALLNAMDLRRHDNAYQEDLDIFKQLVGQLRGARRSDAEIRGMTERAMKDFQETESLAKKPSASSSAPEPPPERSADAVRKKASGRGRHRP